MVLIDYLDKAKCIYYLKIYEIIYLISIISGIDSSYEIPDALWNRIILLLPKTKCKKKQIGRPRMDDRKAMTAISSILHVLDVSGKHYHEVLVHPVLYMTGFSNGEKMVYSNKCGLMV